MLQWMGGGRRKVKTTKKSIQARQHQFFEQKRQQLRSQGVEELIFHKISQPHENVNSLDIASLKNLSKLAPQHGNDKSEGSKNTSFCTSKPGYAEELRKMKCLENNGGICQNSDLHGTGHAIEATHDAAAHSRATVGTQWTPASASAAVALLGNEPVVCPKAPFTVPREGLQAKVIERKEENLQKIPFISKQEKHVKNNLGLKKPSRLQKFEEFQILDLIKSSHNSAEQKKDAHPEKYAAYVFEGMGQVANCTPKNDNAGCNKTRDEDFGPVRKAKHGKQELPCHATKDQEGRDKSKVHLRRHSFSTVLKQDEERGSITDLESFADSNGEQWSRECHAGRDDSLRDLKYPRERNLWSSSHSMNLHYNNLSSRTLFKERDILSLDYMANLPSPICKISPSYPGSPESAESMGFAIEDEHLFSICSDYGSTNISYDIDAYMSYDFLLDDDDDDDLGDGYGSQASDFRDGYGSLASDGMPSFEFRGCGDHDIPLADDSSGSVGASPSLFGKVRDCSDAVLLTDDSSGPGASTLFAFL